MLTYAIRMQARRNARLKRNETAYADVCYTYAGALQRAPKAQRGSVSMRTYAVIFPDVCYTFAGASDFHEVYTIVMQTYADVYVCIHFC